MKLTMIHFLRTVNTRGMIAREELIREGYNPKSIYRKAEKAASKGYTEFGVVADRPWLTPKGKMFIAEK